MESPAPGSRRDPGRGRGGDPGPGPRRGAGPDLGRGAGRDPGRDAGSGLRRRRRGAQLDAALLEAAWAELVERGYADLTFDAVATRAGTSRSVVYRRWSTRRDLALAALRHRTAGDPGPAPDTGSLRGDLLEILHAMTRRTDVMVLLGVQMGEFYRETGIAPYALREHWLGGGGAAVVEVVRRAERRGEVDPSRVTPRTLRLAADLLRQEVTTTLRAPSAQAVASIVDEVVVPLLTGGKQPVTAEATAHRSAPPRAGRP
nr:TetR/AcrR family transcriptional regulator [Cellulomonas sp. 73-145]